MAGQTDQASSEVPVEDPTAVSEQNIAKARKWFSQARVVGETRNYDYAIECYVGGLELWPEAVEEGHMPLRAIGMARRQAKGKPAGLRQSFKRSTTGKDPLRNMLNAEFLLAMDPFNLNHMEQMFVNAGKAGLRVTTNWIGNIYFDALLAEKKIAPQRLLRVREIFEQMGDELEASGGGPEAVDAYEKALKALNILSNMKPDNAEYFNHLTALSGKLTISKGKYNQEGSTFQESLQDRKAQAELHDRDRMVQDEDRISQLIDSARKDYEANPDVPSKLTVLVDLLIKREREAEEAEAIELLKTYYERTKNYRFKVRTDEIRMGQFRRQARQLGEKLKANPQDKALMAEAQKLKLDALAFEQNTLKEQVTNYPTDHRIRFRYAQALFKASQFDDAIPEFQQARADPRNRAACNLFIGRCFFEKAHYGPAVDTLKDLVSGYQGTGDEISKEVYYWLGRSYEADGTVKEAMVAYNQIIQWDYNFRDVRDRIEKLRQQSAG